MISKLFLIGGVLLLFVNCTKDVAMEPMEATFSCDSIDFQTHVFSLVLNNCATSGCHNSTDMANGFALSSYNEIATIAESAQFLNAIEHNPQATPMPIGSPKLPEESIAAIRCWIENGRPE